MNIYEKIETIRVELAAKKLKKSGKNDYANFCYYTLDDFIPTVNELMLKKKLFSNFSIDGDVATVTIIDIEKPEDQVIFRSPIADAQIKGTTPIQCLGGVHTYMRRYLYLNVFEITEPDLLDAVVGKDLIKSKQDIAPKPQNAPKPQPQAQPQKSKRRIELEKLFEEFTEWNNADKLNQWILSATGLRQKIDGLTEEVYQELLVAIKSSRPLTHPYKEDLNNEQV